MQLNDDIILKNQQSLHEMARDMEQAGYTLIGNTETVLVYSALTDENDEDYWENIIDLSTHICYCDGGPGYEHQYGFDRLYSTENEQREVISLIEQGFGIGVMMNSDQDVFVRWSKWKAYAALFKRNMERLNNRET
jgi:hypothetical protein